MSYVLPDEPRGALRLNLAVDGVWPLLGLMLLGPTPGLAWMAFNSWALGCRRALAHTFAVIGALLAYLFISLFMLSRYQDLLGPLVGERSWLVASLILVGLQAALLALAYWLVLAQQDARDWRITYGEAPRNGLLGLVGFFLVSRFLLAPNKIFLLFGFGWIVMR